MYTVNCIKLSNTTELWAWLEIVQYYCTQCNRPMFDETELVLDLTSEENAHLWLPRSSLMCIFAYKIGTLHTISLFKVNLYLRGFRCFPKSTLWLPRQGVCERASCCHVHGIMLAIHAEQCMPVHLCLKSEQGVYPLVCFILRYANFVVLKSGKPHLKKASR